MLNDLMKPRTVRVLIAAFIVLNVLLYLFVNVHLPVRFYPGGAHDDGLFIRHAKTIDEGHWLGTYSQMTLMKGPGYAIFLALVHIFGVPVMLAHALLYAFAVLYLSLAILKYSRSRAFAVFIFLLTLWNFGPDTARVIRDSIVTPLYLIMLAGLILGLFVYEGKRSRMHLIVAGCAFGFSWLTREDAFVLAITLAVLLLACFIRNRTPGSAGFRVPTTAFLATAGWVLAAAAIVISLPATMNYAKYRYFGIVDVKGDFEKALEALQSIQSGPPVPYVPVPRGSREIAYAVSPTFAQVKNALDDPASPLQGWKTNGCAVYPASCADYEGGWFQWALRDAVAMGGWYKNSRTSSAFYRSVHDEISAACATGRIRCYHTLIPFMPHISREQWKDIPASFGRALALLSFYEKPEPRIPFFIGSREMYWEFAGFLNLHTTQPDDEQAAALARDKCERVATRIYAKLVTGYHYTMPVFLAVGFVAFLVLTFRTVLNRSGLSAYLLVFGLWLTVAARILMLAMVDVSAFPAIHNLYLSYTFPLVACASALSIYLNFSRHGATARLIEPAADRQHLALVAS